MLIPQLILVLSALVFGVFGLLFYVGPAEWAAPVGVVAGSATARTEIRAMYGGLEIGLMACLLWCVPDPARLRMGLAASVVLYGSLAAARLTSIVLEGASPGIHRTVALTELSAAVVCAVGWWLARR